MDADDIPEPSPDVLSEIAEFGPIKRTAEEGIRVITARINHTQDLLEAALDRADVDTAARFRRELSEYQAQLTEYELLLRNRN